VSFPQDLGNKRGDGDHRVRLGKEVFPTKWGAGTFGEMAAENDEGSGLNQARGEPGCPVVVPVVGMNDPGPGAPELSSQG